MLVDEINCFRENDWSDDRVVRLVHDLSNLVDIPSGDERRKVTLHLLHLKMCRITRDEGKLGDCAAYDVSWADEAAAVERPCEGQ